ncbi:MAG: hypothetical protein NWT04_03725 [Verrucomicrobiales bacterium]|nr:hypothetical protein [Verrucomicrobiales bacterium]
MPSSSALSSPRSWNILAASVLLMLSGWTLGTDLAHKGHFLLQDSSSSVFLGLFSALWMFVAIVLAGFPKRFVTAAIFLTMVRLSFAWPLVIWFDLRNSSLLLDSLLLILALGYLAVSLKSATLRARPWLRWQHSVAMGATAMVASLISMPVGLLGLARVIEDTSAGYVRLTPGGIDLTERIFERDGRRVHLVGMAHIADSSFYETLNQSLAGPVAGRRLVLLEGVSDADKILPRSFTSGDTYRAIAGKLGLAEQTLGFAVQSDTEPAKDTGPEWEARGVDFRRADIDVRELDPKHRRQLVTLLSAMANLDLASFLSMPD